VIIMTRKELEQILAADDAARAEHEAFMRKLERDRGPSLEELRKMAQEHEIMMRAWREMNDG
jgi:hypothetical protein